MLPFFVQVTLEKVINELQTENELQKQTKVIQFEMNSFDEFGHGYRVWRRSFLVK
jgi:hypothetical protein